MLFCPDSGVQGSPSHLQALFYSLFSQGSFYSLNSRFSRLFPEEWKATPVFPRVCWWFSWLLGCVLLPPVSRLSRLGPVFCVVCSEALSGFGWCSRVSAEKLFGGASVRLVWKSGEWALSSGRSAALEGSLQAPAGAVPRHPAWISVFRWSLSLKTPVKSGLLLLF